MEETFKDRMKKAGGCTWWMIGILCFFCVFIMLGGLLMCLVGETAGGIVFLVVGGVCLLFFVGIFVVLPYVQWKKGIEAKPITLPEDYKRGQISKESILASLYHDAENKKVTSPLISAGIIVIVFLIYNYFNDLTDFSKLWILILIECVIFLLGLLAFLSAKKLIKNFDKIQVEFYKRPVVKKSSILGIDGQQDTYRFFFEDFRGYYEMVQNINLSNEINVGDECVLVCYNGRKSIAEMYCMKHWDVAEDILCEIK